MSEENDILSDTSVDDRVADLQTKLALVDSKLAVDRFNYDVSVKAVDLFLQASRQAALLALALIASSSIWDDLFVLLWSRIWLAALVISVLCSVGLHLGYSLMYQVVPKRMLTEDHDLQRIEKDDKDLQSAVRFSRASTLGQLFILIMPLFAILWNWIFS
ncbi:MAG: hypothetical protein RLN78_01845 [Phycisphaerales bacterium]